MLDNEFKFYLDHQEELLPTYSGKYVMIVGNKVVGAYDTNLQPTTVLPS